MSESWQRTSAFRSLFDRAGQEDSWSIPNAIQLACVLEATAPKIGNVHPGRAFKDMNYDHFLLSAIAIGRAFEDVSNQSIGQLVLSAVQATRAEVGVNTNLGMILLLAPLAKAYSATSPSSIEQWRSGVSTQLAKLTPEDSRWVYQAIQVAKPGGIGDVQQNDVRHDAPADLVAAMRQVATFDAVARQYTNDFQDIFCTLVPWLDEALDHVRDTFSSICEIQLRWMAKEPDGLIVRKAGIGVATEIQKRVRETLEHSGLDRNGQVLDWDRTGQALLDLDRNGQALLDLDRFLCSEGNRYNPGTTADLIAATLFVRILVSQ